MKPGFAQQLVQWQPVHGRTGLPWQHTRDPYRVWLSEIMLQQTQASVVIPYYQRFLQHFPSVEALAAASVDEVMQLWAGLGYYARARNLHACAIAVVERHGGAFPQSAAELAELPGIGRSTAAAIASFCFQERAAILDGNVKRVLARHFGIEGSPVSKGVEKQLWERAEAELPEAPDMATYTQALMDLGATVCTRSRPQCLLCPVRESCVAYRTQRTAELPAPKPRKTTPTHQIHLLVALHQDAVLLEQRPPTGIWGGLLAFPLFDDPKQLAAEAARLGSLKAIKQLPQRRHSFTHFTWVMTPHLACLGRLTTLAAESSQRWLGLRDASTAALPAPLRALIEDLQAQTS